MKKNPELELAFDFVKFTNRNIFLTGKAGTGKTTFLHHLREVSPKRMVVVAPTGVAAINAGGVTIHSFFQMPFGPILPGRLNQKSNEGRNSFIRKFNKRKINMIRSLDLLVIDEISMVRADLLDGIDHVLRRYKNKSKPFGGTQVLMIGDLQQLAPVVKEDEWNLLRDHYDTAFFFSSSVFRESNTVTIELKHIYRQQDDEFINILNEIRDNRLTPESLEKLNKRFIQGFSPKDGEGFITLTTHNAIADRINKEQLRKVKAPKYSFEAEVSGQFPEYAFPAEQSLVIKEGAQVMFIKNDSSPEKRYFNGKIGRVAEIDEETIFVECGDDESPIEVGRALWENIRYAVNDHSKEIEEKVAGTFVQFPLRLAWAITIHKSQGLTFEKAVIDANAAFAHGQTYVALSRCKSLEGLVLSSRISPNGIICDPTIGKFNSNVEQHQPDMQVLLQSKVNYRIELLDELFSYRQLQYHTEKCFKLTEEHNRTIQGDLHDVLKSVLSEGINPLLEIGRKFTLQLNQMHQQQQQEEKIQERIRKGAHYFLEEQTKKIWEPIGKSDFVSDNTVVKTQLADNLSKIEELLRVKAACLKQCTKGFNLAEYLKIRAIAALDQPGKKPSNAKRISQKMSEHPELYETLRRWRDIIARDEHIQHYRIISQRTLLEISNTLPGNEHQLQEIKGFGRRKQQQFGEDILDIVISYCERNDLEPRFAKPKAKPVKKDTKEISYELFKEGKSVREIAATRNFAETTIEGHLAHYVARGEIDISLFVDKQTREAVSEFFEKNPGLGLSAAKEALDHKFTYSELKMVRSHLEFLASQ